MDSNVDQPLYVLTLEVQSRCSDAVAQTLRAYLDVEPVERVRPGGAQTWLESYVHDEIAARLTASALATVDGVVGASVQPCQAEDWTTFWRHHFKSHEIGERFWICPVWDRDQKVPADRLPLYINPGMSFGTGDHFTTRFCLEQLEHLCDKATPLSLLDVGTGSGLLAIAAAKLAYAPIVGVDHDQCALDAAAANAEMNGVSDRIVYRVEEVAESVASETYGVVCANLFADLLMDTAGYLARSAERFVVVSGIKEMQTEGVAEAFLRLGCKQVMCDGDGEWSGLVFEVNE